MRHRNSSKIGLNCFLKLPWLIPIVVLTGWVRQYSQSKGSVLFRNSPRVILNVERQERAQYPYEARHDAVGTNSWGPTTPTVHNLSEFNLCTRVQLCCHNATEDFPTWLWAPAIGSSRKNCQALWRCCRLGRIPQCCPVSLRNCVSWCLGSPAAQFEPRGCVAGGRLDALSAQVLPAVGQLCPGVCAPSDRVDAGWSARLDMLTWALGNSQL